METYQATSEIIMCTLTEAGAKDATDAWNRLFQEALVARELVPGGLRLTVIPDAEPALRQLIEMEIECCRWITFEFDGPSVTLTFPGEQGEQAIREMWAGTTGALPAEVKRIE
jgi:hypothetical protein